MGEPEGASGEGSSRSLPPEPPDDGGGIFQYPPNQDLQKEKNKYSSGRDRGPFFVFVQSTDVELSGLNPISFGKIFYTALPQYKHGVLGISSLGRKKVRVEFKTAKAANSFVEEDQFMVKYKLSIFIPFHLVQRQGVVRGIPVDISCEELYHDIISPLEVVKVKRFVKKAVNQVMPSVLVSFRGQDLPDYVVIHSVRSPVTPFIPPVVLCSKCVRYGHSQQNCKNRLRCPRCLGLHELSECEDDSPIECSFCSGSHLPIERDECPEFQKQVKIKKLMTLNNYSFREANDWVNFNPFSQVLSSPRKPINFNNPIEFPPLVANGQAYQANVRQPKKRTIQSSDSNGEGSHRFHQERRRVFKKPRPITKNNDIEYYRSQRGEEVAPSSPITNPYPPQYHRLDVSSDQGSLSENIINFISHNVDNVEVLDGIKRFIEFKLNPT